MERHGLGTLTATCVLVAFVLYVVQQMGWGP